MQSKAKKYTLVSVQCNMLITKLYIYILGREHVLSVFLMKPSL